MLKKIIIALLIAAVMTAAPGFAADVKVSDLPAASALGGTETFPVVQGGTTKKATATQISTYVQTAFSACTGTPSAGTLIYYTNGNTPPGCAFFTPGSALQLNQSGAGPIDFAGSTITAGQVPTAISAAGVMTGVTLSAKNAQTSTYQVLAGDFTSYKTITVASGTFTITLVASGSQPANGTYIRVINYGSGVVTIARSGQNINGGTSSLTLGAGSATAPTAAQIMSDGTDYFASVQAFTPSSTDTLTNKTLVNQLSVSETVTAGTTQTQAGATALSAVANVHFITTGNDNDGVRMPTCDAAANGQVHYLSASTTSRDVRVYGAGTDTINSVATATGAKQTGGSGLIPYICIGGSPGNWISTWNRFVGTTSQVSIAYGSGGTLTFTTPQSINTTSTPGFTGIKNPTSLVWSGTAPTLASGGCTSPTAVTANGTAAFSVGVGTGCSGSQPLVFTLPAATTGWSCTARNASNAASSAPRHSNAVSTTNVTITNYAATTGIAAAWTDSDVVVVACSGY